MNHCCPAVLHICCDAFETCTLGEISCQKHPKQEIRKFVWDSYFVGIKLINGTTESTELAEVLRSCGYVEPFLSLSLVSSDHVTQCNVLLAQEQQCRCSLRIWPHFQINSSLPELFRPQNQGFGSHQLGCFKAKATLQPN